MRNYLFLLVALVLATAVGCEKEVQVSPQDEEGPSLSYFGEVPDNLPEILTAIEAMRTQILSLIEDGVLNGPNGNGLLSELKNIERKVKDGNMTAAFDMLDGLMNHIQNLMLDGVLTEEQMNLLMGYCANIEAAILGKVYLVEEDFEGYPLDLYPADWLRAWGSPSNQKISDIKAHSGTQSFQLYGMPSWSIVAYKEFADVPDEVYLEGYLNAEMLAGPYYSGWPVASFGLWNKESYIWGMYYAVVNFVENGKITLAASYIPAIEIGTWTPDTWYQVRIKYNQITHMASVWIDGELKASDVHLYDTAINEPHGVYDGPALVSGNATYVMAYFDDIKLWYTP